MIASCFVIITSTAHKRSARQDYYVCPKSVGWREKDVYCARLRPVTVDPTIILFLESRPIIPALIVSSPRQSLKVFGHGCQYISLYACLIVLTESLT